MKGIYTEFKVREIPFLLEIKPDFIWTGASDEQKLKQLRDNGIKIFRSIGVFCARDDIEKLKNRAIEKNGSPVKTYRGWYTGVCPTDQEVILKRLSEIETAFNSPYVDGVWLDSIRYPTYWETPTPEYLDTCYCKRCLSMFRKSGLSWKNFRLEQISCFIRKAFKLKQDKLLGYFAVPETNQNLETIFIQPLKIFKNYVDYVSPMIYPQMVHKNNMWARVIVKKYIDVFGLDKIIPIMQLVKMPENSNDVFTKDDARKLSIALNLSNNLGYFMLGQIIDDESRKRMLKLFFT